MSRPTEPTWHNASADLGVGPLILSLGEAQLRRCSGVRKPVHGQQQSDATVKPTVVSSRLEPGMAHAILRPVACCEFWLCVMSAVEKPRLRPSTWRWGSSCCNSTFQYSAVRDQPGDNTRQAQTTTPARVTANTVCVCWLLKLIFVFSEPVLCAIPWS